ncbi:MAG: hypothetical protein KDK04_22095, partial [Candidatus Competibacteraceae bacterium]|nr:hypothetical protein [Candidatus Competibacteraceae bacterium]
VSKPLHQKAIRGAAEHAAPGIFSFKIYLDHNIAVPAGICAKNDRKLPQQVFIKPAIMAFFVNTLNALPIL